MNTTTNNSASVVHLGSSWPVATGGIRGV